MNKLIKLFTVKLTVKIVFHRETTKVGKSRDENAKHVQAKLLR